jgi:nitric oxide reductase NorD protein
VEIDEKLFHFAWKTKKKFQKNKTSENAVHLEEYTTRLTTITNAFFGSSFNIKSAEVNGALIGQSLFLPKSIDIYDDKDKNLDVYIFRILFESVAFHLGFNLKENILKRSDLNILSLISLPTLIKSSLEEYPKLNETLNLYIKKEVKSHSISKKSKGKEYFYNIWLFSILDESVCINSKISDKQKEFILEKVKDQHLTPSESITTAMKSKNLLKSLGVESQCNTYFTPLFSRLATPAQKLKISKQKDTEINESDSKKEKTVKETKSKESVKNIELDEENPDCNPANLLMEGVQTADIFSGGNKMIDGDDEMDDHFDAIEDLDIRELTRSNKQTQSIFKAEISVDIDYDDQGTQEDLIKYKFRYDEWDYKKRVYKKDWCYLQENNLKTTQNHQKMENFKKYQSDILSDHHKEIKRLKQKIENILIQKRPKNRQADGPEIDIDALINAKADIVSGHNPSKNMYISKRKAPSDISVLLLIDSSLSADSWVEGRRVMDIAKESIIVIQDVLNGLFDNIMVASFYSNTRKNCVFNTVKGFNEPWSSCAQRLDEVKPTGYTRIGVALRHSFTHLEKVKSKNKVVLLLSDGKPTDYDAYEGKLGISDVRQCVREANKENIFIYSLAIDKDSKFYFPQLFGAKNYEVLHSPKTLPEQLIKLFSQII